MQYGLVGLVEMITFSPTPGFSNSIISVFRLFHSSRTNFLWFDPELEQMFDSHKQTEMKWTQKMLKIAIKKTKNMWINRTVSQQQKKRN